MPLYRYKCQSCGAIKERILPVDKSTTPGPCPVCQGVLERDPQGLTTSVVERIDNGYMPRTLERPAEAERLARERHDSHQRK